MIKVCMSMTQCISKHLMMIIKISRIIKSYNNNYKKNRFFVHDIYNVTENEPTIPLKPFIKLFDPEQAT